MLYWSFNCCINYFANISCSCLTIRIYCITGNLVMFIGLQNNCLLENMFNNLFERTKSIIVKSKNIFSLNFTYS